ncbi:hypothetical protein K502DRAFT_342568 [Neoconidiobolus thromboides FSU 785]|nr:hypothetical protein K502DRAFT_342568 [Neoconidiobolus thromboides FSU 785]
MELSKWENDIGNVIDKLYSKDKSQSDSVIDTLFTHDIKYEQVLFTVQGKESVKKVFHLLKDLNAGSNIVQSFNFDSGNYQCIVSFHQEIRLPYLPLPSINFPVYTLYQFTEVNESKYMLNRIQDVVDPQSILSSLPILGGLYNSLFRPLTGAAVVSLSTFMENPHVLKAANNAEKIVTNGGDMLKEQRNQIFATTGRYIQATEKIANEAINLAQETANGASQRINNAVNGLVSPTSGAPNGNQGNGSV